MQPQTAPPPETPPPPRQPRQIPWGLITVIALGLVIVFVPGWLTGLLPGIPNPFEEETVDRSGPAVLKSIHDIEELHSATGHYEVIVDLEKDTALPAQVLGERTLFVGVGDVDAVIDLAQLEEDDVEVSDDGRRAVIRLLQPRLDDVALDLDLSYVYDRQEGVLNEIGDLFGGNDTGEREVFLAGERKIRDAAESSPELKRAARENAGARSRRCSRRSASRPSTSATARSSPKPPAGRKGRRPCRRRRAPRRRPGGEICPRRGGAEATSTSVPGASPWS